MGAFAGTTTERPSVHEHHSRAADRPAGRAGGGPAVPHRHGQVCRRSRAPRHAARGGAPQQRGAWPHQDDRRVRGTGATGRACCDHRGRDRRPCSADPDPAGEHALVQAVHAAGDRT